MLLPGGATIACFAWLSSLLSVPYEGEGVVEYTVWAMPRNKIPVPNVYNSSSRGLFEVCTIFRRRIVRFRSRRIP